VKELSQPEHTSQNRWILLLVVWALHGFLALQEFLAGMDFQLWRSPARLIVATLLLSWVFLNVAVVVSVAKQAGLRVKLQEGLSRPRVRSVLFLITTSMLILLASIMMIGSLMRGELMTAYGGYILLLWPVIKLFAVVSIEMSALFVFFNLRDATGHGKSLGAFVVRLVIILTMLYLMAVVISFTGLGIVPSHDGDWSRGLPAVPLLEWQLVLACVLCLSVMFLEARERALQPARPDVWICLAIWALTVVFWTSQPVVPNSTALKPHEPNFEVYPFTDAQTYDEFSQSVLVGNGFGEDNIPQRPLYIVFLVFAHVLVGQEYTQVVFLQSVLFAVFPVLLYLLGTELVGRPVGIAIALLAVLRDFTSNLVSPFTGNISYSKLYLSEIPTAIFLILALLVAIRWIKTGFPPSLGFFLGGILGAGILIRTQTIVALPVILLFALPIRRATIIALGKSVFIMLLTIAVMISPWLWRNWQMTGEIIFDSPESQTANLALRYGRLNGMQPDITRQAGESSSEYNARLNGMARDAISSNPVAAIGGVTNFFLNHAVNNILLLPLRQDIQSLSELWVPSDAFWQRWEGRPTAVQSILLIFYIFLFGLGLTTAWVRNGLLGFLPLALNLLYNLWTSLALLSGQRFMLAMDWSIYFYYMTGLFTLLNGFLLVLPEGRSIALRWHERNRTLQTVSVPHFSQWQLILPGLLFLGIGLSLPVSEGLFPQKYPPRPQEKILEGLTNSTVLEQTGFDPVCMQHSLSRGQLSIAEGRVLYPRYYSPGDGENFTDAIGYRTVDQGRLVFDMVGQVNGRIIFPMSQSPDFFPNGADAILMSGDNGMPWFVFVQQDDVQRFYVSEAVDNFSCN
jgi:hypothetical protein